MIAKDLNDGTTLKLNGQKTFMWLTPNSWDLGSVSWVVEIWYFNAKKINSWCSNIGYLLTAIIYFFWTMQILMHALSRPPFGNYRVWWSLADSKYAGTALFVKKCFQPKKVSFSIDQKGIMDRIFLLFYHMKNFLLWSIVNSFHG